MNSFLEPLVKDLLKLWNGVEMTAADGNKTVRAALLCTASDVPATRKLSGFVRHWIFERVFKVSKTLSNYRIWNQT